VPVSDNSDGLARRKHTFPHKTFGKTLLTLLLAYNEFRKEVWNFCIRGDGGRNNLRDCLIFKRPTHPPWRRLNVFQL
jgi:hypothetical protein